MNNIDELFRKSLTTHKVETGHLAWEKIDKRLNKHHVPVWEIWGQWSVAVAVGLAVISLYFFQPEIEQQNTPFTLGTSSGVSSDPLANISGDENPGLSDTGQVKPDQEIAVSESQQKAKEGKPTTVPKKERGFEARAIIAEKLFDLALKAPPKVGIPTRDIAFNSSQLAKSANEDDTLIDDYKIIIVSRGYAFIPEKENFVEEIENKIGGFLHKVDQGFSGIQDRKDNLFASLTSKNQQKK